MNKRNNFHTQIFVFNSLRADYYTLYTRLELCIAKEWMNGKRDAIDSVAQMKLNLWMNFSKRK